jgi:hypothetical protein
MLYFAPSTRRDSRGAALIIVLAFVVLLTILVVAYFSRTITERQLSNSSVNQAMADEIARSALDIVTSNLKAEITGTGSVQVSGSTANSVTFYVPVAGSDAVPMRNGNPPIAAGVDPIPNLVRISTTLPIQGPGVDQLASGVSSTVPSANGRSISPSRWNKHYLIPRDPAIYGGANASLIGTQPIPQFTAPMWIMLTNSGPTQIASPSTAVTGRYAYAVYDEGGLLDLNVAGYPSTAPSDLSSRKYGLAYADLKQIGLTGSDIDNIVGWRNYNTAQAQSAFPQYTFSGTIGAYSYDQAIVSNTTGFLTISGTPSAGAATDQAFVSRQELLQLRNTLGFSQDALQYLGTFSRETNAPTFFYPDSTTTGTAGLAANDPVTNGTNVDILKYRMATSGSAPDGFSWNAGDPAVPRRFSLDRLVLLTSTATNTSTTSAIYKYFGLYRTSGTGAWIYCGSDGPTTDAGAISTLDNVAANGREPNFFELLKAAIHRDSIGVSTGFSHATNSDQTRGMVGEADLIDELDDLQIFRIGANIINQAQPDNFPVTIEYIPTGQTSPLYAYGVADLPYINALGIRLVLNSYFGSKPFYDVGALQRDVMDEFVPVLWNPHRSLNPSASRQSPAQIQFYMTGETSYQLNGGYVVPPVNGSQGSVSDPYNDNINYTSSTDSHRLNQMGLGAFTLSGSSVNNGSIIIDTTKYPLSNFDQPAFLNYSAGSNGITATGPYQPLLGATNGQVYGLILSNHVVGAGRQGMHTLAHNDFPSAAVAPGGTPQFDGYYSGSIGNNPHGTHHTLYFGVNGAGVNAVLRYLDADGIHWHVYNAMASNEADPNGYVNPFYDAFGIDYAGKSAAGGLPIGMLDTEHFLAYLQVGITGAALYSGDPNWTTPNPTQMPPGTSFNGNIYDIVGLQDHANDNLYGILKADPRTGRFGLGGDGPLVNIADYVHDPGLNTTIGSTYYYNTLTRGAAMSGSGYGFLWANLNAPSGVQHITTDTGASSAAYNVLPGMWSQNSTKNGVGTYYYDYGPSGNQSGKVRPGDDYWTGASGTNNIYQAVDARPIILNRPFRSVGELGYVYRDMPFKSLDFASTVSADAALIDYFCVGTSQTAMVAGKVDINTRQQPVLNAIISGAIRQEISVSPSVTISSTDASAIATNLITAINTHTLLNKAGLVGALSQTTSTIFDSGATNSSYPSIKTQREAPVRALADVANTRTWNLMIDIIAQTGQYSVGAKGLDQFTVTGERRYWLHIAIDRYTGAVIDQVLEPVYE